MKKASLILCLALLALMTAGTRSAFATNVPLYSNGDLLLGFYDYSSSVTNDYLVDLGPLSGFNFTHNFVIYSSTTNIGTDLNHIFSSSDSGAWFTSGNIVFGLAASYPASNQLFLSNPNDTPWEESNAQATPAQGIESVGQLYSGHSQTGGEQNPRGLEQSDSTPNSWYAQAPGTFGDSNLSGAGGDNAISQFIGDDAQFDELNAVASGNPASTILGTFSIDSAGDVSFDTASVVPEPSTFAAVGFGALALIFITRRGRRLA